MIIEILAIGVLVSVACYAIYLVGYVEGNKDGFAGKNKHPQNEERFY